MGNFADVKFKNVLTTLNIWQSHFYVCVESEMMRFILIRIGKSANYSDEMLEFDSKGKKIKAITSASTWLVNKKQVSLNLSKEALLSSLFHNITQ